jgi:hypothetical protein
MRAVHAQEVVMKRGLIVLGAAALLAACAGYSAQGIAPGQTAAQVEQQLGPPTGRHRLPDGGTRLEYARGPYGKHTYMVDLDTAGRVAGWQQVLTEANFNQVAGEAGMPVDELLRRLGRPTHRRSGGWQPGEVWSWRYDAVFCQWFQVDVVAGRVRGAAYGPDPLCDIDRDDGR